MQEIISEEIVDETDMYESNRIKRRAKRQSTSVVMRGYAYIYSRAQRHSYFISIVENRLRLTETISSIGDYSPLLPTAILDIAINPDGTPNYGTVSASPRR